MANRKKVRLVGTMKVVPRACVGAYKHKSAPGFYTYNSGPLTTPTINRRIGPSSDITYQTGGDGAFRPCTHLTAAYTCNPVNDVVLISRPLPTFVPYSYQLFTGLQRQGHARYYQEFLNGVLSSNTDVESINWNALSAMALSNMMPSFGGANSLINFIIELKDFRRLGQALAGKTSGSFKILKEVVGYRKQRGPMANLSSAYLSYNFAWKPLYYDLVSLVDTLLQFTKKYNKLVSEANTDLQKHFSITVAGTASNASTYFSSGSQGPLGGWTGYAEPSYRTRVRLDKCEGVRYNATLRYRYPLPKELREAGGKAKAFLDALGVAGDPAIVWNAIPFSFVVDWVVNVGRWLSQMRVDNIRFQTEIRDFCHSAVITRNVHYELQAAVSTYSPTNVKTIVWMDWQTTDSCRKRAYVRKRGLPNFLTAMQTSGLNIREFTLAGALLNANTSRVRKR